MKELEYTWTGTCWACEYIPLSPKNYSICESIAVVCAGNSLKINENNERVLKNVIENLDIYYSFCLDFFKSKEKESLIEAENYITSIRSLDETNNNFTIDLDFEYSVISVLFENFHPVNNLYLENIWDEYDY